MGEAQHVAPEMVPSVSDYVAGFRRIEADLTENQRRMLVNHYASPCRVTTATELAASVAFVGLAGANLQYGVLGQKLAAAMGIDGYWAIEMLVLMVPHDSVTNQHWLWVMRENVAHTLEELGWVPKTSQLFFPHGRSESPPDS